MVTGNRRPLPRNACTRRQHARNHCRSESMTGVLRHWMAFGTGAGIEISGPRGEESLHAALVRVRPGSARVLDEFIVDDAQTQAGVWGINYAKLLRKHGMGHVAATV